MVGLLWAAYAARETSWRVVYQRLGVGMGVAFALLVPHSSTVAPITYQTQAIVDTGRMLPFWFGAWAVAAAPVSDRERPGYAGDATGLAPATLLFGTLIAVPIVGFGLRFLQPLGDPIDRGRDHQWFRQLVTSHPFMPLGADGASLSKASGGWPAFPVHGISRPQHFPSNLRREKKLLTFNIERLPQ
jgi:hypothetical protein